MGPAPIMGTEPFGKFTGDRARQRLRGREDVVVGIEERSRARRRISGSRQSQITPAAVRCSWQRFAADFVSARRRSVDSRAAAALAGRDNVNHIEATGRSIKRFKETR